MGRQYDIVEVAVAGVERRLVLEDVKRGAGNAPCDGDFVIVRQVHDPRWARLALAMSRHHVERLPDAFGGHGMWIWELPNSSGGDLTSIVMTSCLSIR